jgi:sugar/nucleoside kinase (ribokinase family)
MLRPPAETLPPRYRGAKAFHVGVHPERPDATLLKALREKGIFGGDDEKNKNENASTRVLLSVEPFTRATRPVSIETLHTLCSAGDVFSPNELEAVSLVGEGSPAELCRRLADAGAKIVCVRRGEKGAVVHNAATGETWDVPAFLEDQSRLADVTGCGNAFCGGFMAGLVSGESLDRAACWGSAAASVMAEHVGVPTVPAGDARTRAEVRRRFEALLRRTAKIDE